MGLILKFVSDPKWADSFLEQAISGLKNVKSHLNLGSFSSEQS